MTSDPKQELTQRFVDGRLSRREFAAGALALGLSAGTVRAVLAQPDPIKALDTVDGTFPLTQEKVTFRVLVPSNPRVEDFATNRFTQWYEEKTNVHLEWEVVPAQEAQTSLNVRLAGGDLPDIIMGFESALGPSLQMLYGSQGAFLRLNDLIEQHGVETKRLFEQMPLAREVITAPDGSIYALPAVAGCYHCTLSQKLWLYQPWLDELGLAMPTTTDEFEQVLLAFKERDPNGTGQPDEIPLATATEGFQTSLDAFFMNAFTYNPGPGGKWLSVQDGTVTAIYATAPWRAGLEYLARLYAQGLIGSESFTQDLDQLRQLTNNPGTTIVGAVPAGAPSAFINVDREEGSRWTQYTAVPPLAGPEGVRFAASNPYQAFRSGAFVVTSACQQPEIALRWADGLYDLETSLRAVEGVLGEHWRWAEPGEVGNNGEPAVWERLFAYGQVQNFSWSQTGPYYRPEPVHSGQVLKPEEAAYSLETILYRATKDKYEPQAQPAELVLPPLFFSQEQAQQVADLDATINAYVEESFALAVTGQLDIAAEWETYLATLEGMGLAQYLQIHQEAYDARPTA
jgi:putative aldouronate transport system substrate-binding protein